MNIEPPRRLSNETSHPDFHPSYARVGVRVDGVERNDIRWYCLDKKLYQTTGSIKANGITEATSIEAFWRYDESRQQRRARERWEGKHK